MKKILYSIFGLAYVSIMLVMISGCSTSGLVAGDSSYTDSPYFIVDDRIFGSQVKIVSVGKDFKGDMMRGYATLRSRRHRSLQIRYKFSWYDDKGIEIDPGTRSYHDVVIQGKDTITISSMAPNPQAQEFKVRVVKVKVLKIENVL